MIRELGLTVIGMYVKNKANVEKIEKRLYLGLVNGQVSVCDVESTDSVKVDEEIYKWCLYQIIGTILQSGQAETFSALKKGEIGWSASQYKETSKKLDEIDDYLINPFEVAEGINECKCGSKKTWSFTKQTRSADEPATTFCKCVMCGTSWSYSG